MADPVYGINDIDQSPGSVALPTTNVVHAAAPVAPSWTDFYRQQVDRNTQFRNPYSYINQQQARDQQMQVIQDLQRQAAGDMNSLAQQQLRAGYGQAQAQQSSLGSSMRGQGAGAAMRGIQQGQAGIQRGFAGDQQMLKLQDPAAAAGHRAGAGHGARAVGRAGAQSGDAAVLHLGAHWLDAGRLPVRRGHGSGATRLRP